MLASIQHIRAYGIYDSISGYENGFLGTTPYCMVHTEKFEQETTPKLNNKETASNNPRLQSGQRSIANLNPKSNLYITYKVHTVVELGLLDSDFNNQLSRYLLRLFLFTARVPGTEPGYFLTKGVKVRMIVRWYQTVPTKN